MGDVYGFHHLELNLSQHDREKLDAKYKMLQLIKEDPREPGILHDALDLWMAHIINVNPRRKQEALKKMEDIVRRNPKHINTLADLQVFYKHVGLDVQSQEQQNKLQHLKEKPGNHELKALADFEQAYVILFTEPDNAQKIMIQKLKETGDISRHMEHIPFNQHHADAESALPNVPVATVYMTQARDQRVKVLKEETLTRYRESMAKIDNALTAFKDDEETTRIYKYLLYFKAFAHLRYHTENKSGRKEDENQELHQTLTFFWDFIQSLVVDEADSFDLYKGRALAHIASTVPTDREVPDDLPAGLKTLMINLETTCDEAEALLKIPVKDFPDQAYEMDSIGAERLARTKIHIAKCNPRIRQTSYEDARRYLDMAMQSPDKCGWFTFATSRDVSCHLFRSSKRIQHLMTAYKDARKCILSKRTPSDLSILGEICYLISQHDERSREKYLRESVIYLTEANAHGEEKNYFATCNMGRSLKSLGENRSALEWMKKAMCLADPRRLSTKFGFAFPFQYLLDEYCELKLPKEKKTYLLLEFRYLVQEGIGLFGSVDRELGEAFRSNERICIDFIIFLAVHPFKVRQDQKTVIGHCLDIVSISPGEKCHLHDKAMQMRHMVKTTSFSLILKCLSAQTER